ncbi:C40 family peptidase [Rhodococcus sp. BGS-1C]|uniref:C40 family peptidase n=1 Tax=Nocardiaceae TaxID=85025 RepID=UPI0019D1E3BA|nr:MULTISPECIES: NlpC/P60 family protein [Rhodococcus]MCC8928486.1 C40 family peptidase [Rhodococcus sp. I2R]MCZ4277110.1 NlpC/P60 family protein [Rhodococcus yunnanensis]
MIDLLAKPITDLLGAFGSGVVPVGGPADVLRTTSIALESLQRVGGAAVSELAATWSGRAAEQAIGHAEQAHTSAIGLADHGSDMAAVVDRACEKVYAGLVELQAIAQSFISIATAAAPMIFTPPGQSMLIAAAIEHLQRALAVVARVRAELAGHTGEIGALSAAPPIPEPAGTAPSTVPASAVPTAAPGSDPGSQFGQNFLRTVSSSASSVLPDTSSLPTGQSAASGGGNGVLQNGASMFAGAPQRSSAEVAPSGRGVQVALPDGTVAIAPNEQAAGAVRSALTQQGTPYVWGGNAPGRGLDCSGLTQWAYGEQGVDLPRLAQEQNVGTSVGPEDLMPGDLAVWDGHVAMVIGNGQLVEAGDPVQVGEIRTTNSGMAFKGFYRPTA